MTDTGLSDVKLTIHWSLMIRMTTREVFLDEAIVPYFIYSYLVSVISLKQKLFV